MRRLGGARPTWGSGGAGASGRPGGRRGGSRRSRGAPRRPCTPHTHPRSSGTSERHAASGRPGMGQRPPRETPLAGSLLKSRPDCLLPRAPQGPPTSETLAPNTCWPIPLGKNGPYKEGWFLAGACAPGGPKTTRPHPWGSGGAGPAVFPLALVTRCPLRLRPACALAWIAPTVPPWTPLPSEAPRGLQGWAAPHSDERTHCSNPPPQAPAAQELLGAGMSPSHFLVPRGPAQRLAGVSGSPAETVLGAQGRT